jgi:alpha-2-macroglobulin
MKKTWVVALLAGMATQAQALQITQVSPSGTVALARQVVVRTDAPAINFGDGTAAAPVTISCSEGAAAQGTGRWTTASEWVYDFAQDLPAATKCDIKVNAGFKSHKGEALSGPKNFAFNTGAPTVVQTYPYEGSTVEEHQIFVLQLNGMVTAQSLAKGMACSSEASGEQVNVEVLAGKEKTAAIAAAISPEMAKKAPTRLMSFEVLRCLRPIAPGTQMQLIYGPGIQTAEGVVHTARKLIGFTVREAFAANFTCERERAQAPCWPVRPMSLRFNATVSKKLLEGIRLGSMKPSKISDDGEYAMVEFNPPLPHNAKFSIELPRGFADESGRVLRNADQFPLAVATSDAPPLVKFSAAPFGIVERLAEPKLGALLPMTLRHVEPGAQDLSIKTLKLQTDEDIVRWWHKVRRFHESSMSRVDAREIISTAMPPPDPKDKNDRSVQTRAVGLLHGKSPAGAQELKIAGDAAGKRPFEVVGLPLAPGVHVVEAASNTLGDALLPEDARKTRPMYVRTMALATNLGVHIKIGRDNSAVWVTTLDKGQSVAGAQVRVSDCVGKSLATGTTDAKGVLLLPNITSDVPENKGCQYNAAYFVSARHTAADGVADMAFAWSDWQEGIDPWRFSVQTNHSPKPDVLGHTVLDRSLFRAGETVNMKHYVRTLNSKGFATLAYTEGMQATLTITHQGSGQEFKQAVSWRKHPNGGAVASSSFAIPPQAKLGVYTARLNLQQADPNERYAFSTDFRVEEFRLPVLEGRVSPVVAAAGADKTQAVVNPKKLDVAVQVGYVSGGPASNLPVRVSAGVRDKYVSFAAYDEFRFEPPRDINPKAKTKPAAAQAPSEEGAEDGGEPRESNSGYKLIADKIAVTLDKTGQAKATIPEVPAATRARDLTLEASFSDPNGEVQTLRSNQTIWPSAVVLGMRTEGWVSAKRGMKFQALALNTQGEPMAGVKVQVKAFARIVTTSRKRMVGGFYAYDNQETHKDLGEVCTGESDPKGRVYCEARIEEAGEVELVASAKDAQGNSSFAGASIYVTQQGELWFGGENHDRMDVIPEKKHYKAGETARFQVRMPFRYATAWVAVEREGVLHTEIVKLQGDDPTLDIKIQPEWGPNVYVSVLALRGRLREVPWYSFFTWGFTSPREWWQAYRSDGQDYTAPTAMVDLSKPAFRLGVAEINVDTLAHQLKVSVQSDQASYPVRGTAVLTVSATLPNGQPAANAEVALAVVDQALLELSPNTSWDLMGAMLSPRAWGVVTATGQMEIIGRRHYGKKAAPAGGGGGRSNTRELFDTLLLWQPSVKLDAKGQAKVQVVLNDSLTKFTAVAVADADAGYFGTGQAQFAARQDLQLISGLPPLVREGDVFDAQITVRNTTAKAMTVQVTPRATLLELGALTQEVPAQSAKEFVWRVSAPAQLAYGRFEQIHWQLDARDTTGGDAAATDSVKLVQRIVPAVPLTVRQAQLVQIEAPFNLDVAVPSGALSQPGGKAARGGVQVSVQASLAEGLPSLKDWWRDYPFACLEQKTSKSIGLRDARLWQQVVQGMPNYLDSQGLANYFPPRADSADTGSDVLTAYILSAADEAAKLDANYALPPALADKMTAGLAGFVQGRLERKFWAPRADLDVRKLMAIEALSRYGKANAAMLQSIDGNAANWPTHALIAYWQILKRINDVPARAEKLAQTDSNLRARLTMQGTKAVFSTEDSDYWWWHMVHADVNMARMLMAVMNEPAWKADMPRLMAGFVERMQRGAWHSTTANLWGGLAVDRFSATFENTPVAGSTLAKLGESTKSLDWAAIGREREKGNTSVVATINAKPIKGQPWAAPEVRTELPANAALLPWAEDGKAQLQVTHTGTGKPWLTVQSLAAVKLAAPVVAGYKIDKVIEPIEQASKSGASKGDVLRITLNITAQNDMTWVALRDPIPAGATILGSGLGRDSELSQQGTEQNYRVTFEERAFEGYRAYFAYLPKGQVKLQYVVRLNNVGQFQLPPTRVEAMYAPEMFGESPNADVKVLPR